MANRKSKARYEYFYSATGKGWYFHLIGANGEIQNLSEQYSSKSNCLKGIISHRKNASTEIVTQIFYS